MVVKGEVQSVRSGPPYLIYSIGMTVVDTSFDAAKICGRTDSQPQMA